MATSTERIEQLMGANRTFAETWKNPATMTQVRAARGDRILVLTCMDPRVVPEQFLGPNPFVAVFRNAGGRFSPDVVRTVNVLDNLRDGEGSRPTVMVVHHTDCGMTHVTNDEIKANVRSRTVGGWDDIEKTDFGAFAAEDLEKSVLEDVATLKKEELLHGVRVRGFVLTTETGLLRELDTSV